MVIDAFSWPTCLPFRNQGEGLRTLAGAHSLRNGQSAGGLTGRRKESWRWLRTLNSLDALGNGSQAPGPAPPPPSPPGGMLRAVAPGVSAPHPQDLPSRSWSWEVRHTAPGGSQCHSKRHSSAFKKVMFWAKYFKKLKHRRDLDSAKWGAVPSRAVKIWYLGQKRSQFGSKRGRKEAVHSGRSTGKDPDAGKD